MRLTIAICVKPFHLQWDVYAKEVSIMNIYGKSQLYYPRYPSGRAVGEVVSELKFEQYLAKLAAAKEANRLHQNAKGECKQC